MKYFENVGNTCSLGELLSPRTNVPAFLFISLRTPIKVNIWNIQADRTWDLILISNTPHILKDLLKSSCKKNDIFVHVWVEFI